jgi:hypothetical protein
MEWIAPACPRHSIVEGSLGIYAQETTSRPSHRQISMEITHSILRMLLLPFSLVSVGPDLE